MSKQPTSTFAGIGNLTRPTVTGRVPSEPALQGVPLHTPEGDRVKSVLREDGARMAQWDFSEVEKQLTPVRIIHFKDDGQDFLRWYVAANGVVVCSEPYQTWMWAGTVMLNVRVGRFPTVRSNEGHIRTVKHRVTKVEELTNGKA